MSEYLQKIVYLTKSQYDQLASGTAVGGQTEIKDNYLYITSDTFGIEDITGILPVGKGGTGTGTAPNRWGVIYASTTSAYASTSAGTAGYLLQSNASSAPTWIQATNANNANTIIKRDSSGGFSAGTITANLTGFIGKGTHTAAVTANEFTPSAGMLTVVGNVSNTTMTHTSNANAEMIIKTHPSSGSNYYEARLGFSSNGNLYYMPVNTTSWKTVAYTDSNITGNASTATSATNDSDGNAINTTYFKLTETRAATTSNTFSITDETASSSTSTGALVVDGGMGIAKKLYVGTGIYTGAISIGGSATASDQIARTISVSTSNLLIDTPTGYGIVFKQNNTNKIRLLGNTFYPETTNNGSIGTSDYKWSAIYATTYYGALQSRAETNDLARHVWFAYSTNGSTEDEGVLGKDDDFKYNPSTNVLTTGILTITGGTSSSAASSISSTGTLTVSTTTTALTISTTNGALEAKSTGSGTVKLTGNSGAMTISTTTGALTIQTNGASGANLVLKTAGNAGTVTLQSTKSSVSITSGTTMSISSTTSTSITSTTTMSLAATTTMSISSGSGNSTTINSGSTMYLQRTSTASIIFCSGGTATSNYHGRFNASGNLALETGTDNAGTQNTHKFYVKGDSAFNGKIAFGTAASNAITTQAYMQYNSTDLSIDFVFA